MIAEWAKTEYNEDNVYATIIFLSCYVCTCRYNGPFPTTTLMMTSSVVTHSRGDSGLRQGGADIHVRGTRYS